MSEVVDTGGVEIAESREEVEMAIVDGVYADPDWLAESKEEHAEDDDEELAESIANSALDQLTQDNPIKEAAYAALQSEWGEVEKEWTGPHEGERGGTYWENTETGERHYGDKPPGESGSSEEEESPPDDLAEGEIAPGSELVISEEAGFTFDGEYTVDEIKEYGSDMVVTFEENSAKIPVERMQEAYQEGAVDTEDGEEGGEEESGDSDSASEAEVEWGDVDSAGDLEGALEERISSAFTSAKLDGVDSEQAKSWANAFEDLDEMGWFDDWTSSPTITTEGDNLDGDEHAYWDQSSKEMYLGPERVHDERIFMDYEDGWTSSGHSGHTVYHEAAHAMHYDNLGSRHEEESMSVHSPPEDVADEVSELAKSSRMEFVSEVFAGHMAGEEYSEEVYEHYREYKGPDLPEVNNE